MHNINVITRTCYKFHIVINEFIKTILKMSDEPAVKRFHSYKVSKIGTHDGCFHCDEVLGCFMLKQLYPAAEIVRTRDKNILETCDIVLDVGSVYNHMLARYDHHQLDFNESVSTILKGKSFTMKLSSAGLIYCHYGKDVISVILGKEIETSLKEKIFDKVYDNFIKEIDAIDNGIPMCHNDQAYHISTDLSSRIKRLNKNWNDSNYNETESFNKALILVGQEFTDKILYYFNTWWPARKILLDSVNDRYKTHSSGEIIHLKQIVPWRQHYFDLEEELQLKPTIKYVIFCDSAGDARVQAVPLNAESFELRIPLPAEWRGLRDEILSSISGIKNCIFTHNNGFIGGNKTIKGAMSMAIRSLELSAKSQVEKSDSKEN